jgi:hypothetical protein
MDSPPRCRSFSLSFWEWAGVRGFDLPNTNRGGLRHRSAPPTPNASLSRNYSVNQQEITEEQR